MKKIYHEMEGKVMLCMIFGVFLITRLWRIGIIPYGLHIDEASMAYSAWCLSRYGVDRYLDSWPLYFRNFGGGQSPLYAYLLAGLFKVFGFHLVLIRIPAIFFSFLTLLFGMGIARRLYPENRYAPYITGVLVTICPYFIMAGRLGLDCNLMLGCSAVFLYCFLRAMGSAQGKWYIAAGISGGIMLYTYALSYVMTPLFLIMAMSYMIVSHKFSLKKWVIMAVPMGILAAPLILEQIVNMFGLEPIHLGIFTFTRMDFYRASEFERFSMEGLKGALESIFVGDTLPYNSLPGFLNLYWLSVPLAVVGVGSVTVKLVSYFKKRELCYGAFVLFWFLAVLIVAIHIRSCVNRVNSIYLAYGILVTEGIILAAGLRKPLGNIVFTGIAGIFLICFIRFGNYYLLGGYSADYHPLPYFDILISDGLSFIRENPQYGPKGAQMAEMPVYLGLSTLQSPYELCLFDQDLMVMDYYHCSHLGLIEDGYYYLVKDTFIEYSNDLRASGFTEIVYDGYSLFYRE